MNIRGKLHIHRFNRVRPELTTSWGSVFEGEWRMAVTKDCRCGARQVRILGERGQTVSKQRLGS